MENQERELILRMKEVDARLKRLYDEHERLESELTMYQRRGFLTDQEQARQKQIKFKKLKGVEQMITIVQELQAA